MYKVIISGAAEADLDEIIGYIAVALANPQAADSLTDKIAACYDDLARTPYMYGQCLNLRLQALGYRRVSIQNYIMVYRVDEESKTVYILRFFYGPSDYERLL